MTNKGTSFYERLESRGVSRRDFMKFCGATATMLGLSSSAAPMIGAKLAGAAEEGGLYPALWLHGGACTGCTESVAQATYPNVADIVLDFLNLVGQETIQMSASTQTMEGNEKFAEENAGKFILIVEGTVITGLDGNMLRVGGHTFTYELEKIAKQAAVVIALGACAVDGGWVVAYPNPAEGTGVSAFLKSKGVATPVINMPGCPMNPEELVSVVVEALLINVGDDGIPNIPAIAGKLDSHGRPKWLFGSTIHDNCPRRGHFENGEFVYDFGSEAEAAGYCLYPVGCKGPQTYRRCPMLRWNNNTSWCVDSGGPCIGCANWNWVDNNAPFRGRFRRVGAGVIGDGGIDPAWAAAAIGGVAGAALIAHGFGMKAAKRIGKNSTLKTEECKEYDRKKGGAA